MNANSFDALVRSFRVTGPRRAVLGRLGAGLVSLLTPFTIEETAAKTCKRGKKKCGKKCIAKDKCCGGCGTNERCNAGTCEPCLPQGTDCTDDAQCCTGICDKYTDKCQQVRVSCANGEPCPNGRCCPQYDQCLYVKATQRACEPEVSCSYVVCGDKCSDFDDGTYEYCGYYGSGACRNGRCCCPKGIPLADCPKSGGGLLPRCD